MGVGRELAESWKTRSITHRHADQPPIPSVSLARPLCLIAGFCMHDQQGVMIAAFEAAFVRSVQTFAPPKTLERRLLKASYLVVRLTSRNVSSDASDALWFHIARATLTQGDWRLSFLPLELVGHLHLTVSPGKQWVYTWEAFKDFDLTQHFSLQMHSVRGRPNRLLGAGWRSDNVRVRTVGTPVEFWSGRIPEVPRRPRPPPSLHRPREQGRGRGRGRGRLGGRGAGARGRGAAANAALLALPAPDVAGDLDQAADYVDLEQALEAFLDYRGEMADEDDEGDCPELEDGCTYVAHLQHRS
jgi:hypothetical protein